MKKYKQGDVLILPFPYTDLSTTKNRPAVVVSSNNTNELILAKITSVISNSKFSHKIKSSSLDFEMQKESEIITDFLSTISDKIVIKKIGCINGPEMALILEKIKANLEQ